VIRLWPMIVGHIGLDGSGKTLGMAVDANRALEKQKKMGARAKEVWFLGSGPGKKIKHPLQLLYLGAFEDPDHPGAIVFIDELQRFYPADRTIIDDVTHHIISTHRHSRLTIHWASQDWSFVHPFWRRETAVCWNYEAVWRDRITGESRLGKHRRTLYSGPDMERGRIRKEELDHETLKVKKYKHLFDSWEKLDVETSDLFGEGEEKTLALIAKITDPRSPAPNAAINPLSGQEKHERPIHINSERHELEDRIHWENPTHQGEPTVHSVDKALHDWRHVPHFGKEPSEAGEEESEEAVEEIR